MITVIATSIRSVEGMDNTMKYLQFILLGLTLFIIPMMPRIVLCGLSFVYFKKHDWGKGFFNDKWGALGILSFLSGIIVFVLGIYMPSQR
jgi:hypothetical protein